jgi:hypothetical protein
MRQNFDLAAHHAPCAIFVALHIKRAVTAITARNYRLGYYLIDLGSLFLSLVLSLHQHSHADSCAMFGTGRPATSRPLQPSAEFTNTHFWVSLIYHCASLCKRDPSRRLDDKLNISYHQSVCTCDCADLHCEVKPSDPSYCKFAQLSTFVA